MLILRNSTPTSSNRRLAEFFKKITKSDQGKLISVDLLDMRKLLLQLLALVVGFGSSFLFVSQARANCFGNQNQIDCHDKLTGNIYNRQIRQPPLGSLPRIKHRFGWMPMQSHKKLNDLTIIQGHTAGRKRWRTYGRVYPNGDYRIIGSDSRGPMQRTCINGKCF